MAAIVKANPSLTAGGLAVLRRAFSTTDEGVLNYEADYVCLSQYANNHIGKFRTGAQPPTPIPSAMSVLRLDAVPKLYDFQTSTENGLTYFNAKYTSAVLNYDQDASEVITTETSEQRSFSAQIAGSVRVPGAGGTTSTVEGFTNVSFDYVSYTMRVEAKNSSVLPSVRGRVGLPFNLSVGTISGTSPLLVGKWRASTVEQSSTTKSSRGTYTYSLSSSGIYVVV